MLLLLVPAFAAEARAEEVRTLMAGNIPVRAETLLSGLSHPWGMEGLPGGEILITERSGTLRIFANGELSPPLKGVPAVAAGGQGGLLDVAVSPDFAKDRTIWLTFSEAGEGGAGTALARARLAEGNGRLEQAEVIFRASGKTGSGVHFGSRVVPAPDGTLYVTLGERGERERAQDYFDHAGSVVRINRDGSIPAGNPFAGGKSGLAEIWSKGHRNPQGAAWDPVTASLLTVEHGAQGGDELNRPMAGKNHGWPVISYGLNYDGSRIGEGQAKPGYEQPLHFWDPSIAPSGLAVYSGQMFAEWQGDLLVGALKFQLLSRLDRDASGAILSEERYFASEFGRIRDVAVAPDGAILLLTDEDDGALIRITRG